jgi:hypothetical protein
MGKQSKVLKTPTKRLPIGEPVLLVDGSLGLRIKGKGDTYENLALKTLNTMVRNSLVINVQKASRA